MEWIIRTYSRINVLCLESIISCEWVANGHWFESLVHPRSVIKAWSGKRRLFSVWLSKTDWLKGLTIWSSHYLGVIISKWVLLLLETISVPLLSFICFLGILRGRILDEDYFPFQLRLTIHNVNILTVSLGVSNIILHTETHVPVKDNFQRLEHLHHT